VSEAELLHWLPHGVRSTRYLTGMRQYLANTGAGRSDREREQNAARVYLNAIKELDVAKRKPPFALVVDCFDPHEPWDPPSQYIDPYGDRHYTGSEPGDVLYARSSYMTAAELRRLPAVYAGAVTMTDAWLGRFLDHFHSSGLSEETIVVLLSDHGILLGER